MAANDSLEAASAGPHVFLVVKQVVLIGVAASLQTGLSRFGSNLLGSWGLQEREVEGLRLGFCVGVKLRVLSRYRDSGGDLVVTKELIAQWTGKEGLASQLALLHGKFSHVELQIVGNTDLLRPFVGNRRLFSPWLPSYLLYLRLLFACAQCPKPSLALRSLETIGVCF